MKNVSITRNKDRLDDLFKKISNCSDDVEMQSHWAKYLCVLVSGFIEKSIYIIFSDYSKKNAVPNMSNFVEGKIRRFQNADMKKIISLVSSFNLSWAEAIEKTDDEIKTSVNSIINNKNNIAHGVSVGITFVRIKKYYRDSIVLIEKIESLCC